VIVGGSWAAAGLFGVGGYFTVQGGRKYWWGGKHGGI
jgi:hypothetical protein